MRGKEFGQVGDPEVAGAPGRGRRDPGPDHQRGRVGQRHADEEDAEPEEIPQAQAELRRPTVDGVGCRHDQDIAEEASIEQQERGDHRQAADAAARQKIGRCAEKRECRKREEIEAGALERQRQRPAGEDGDGDEPGPEHVGQPGELLAGDPLAQAFVGPAGVSRHLSSGWR